MIQSNHVNHALFHNPHHPYEAELLANDSTRPSLQNVASDFYVAAPAYTGDNRVLANDGPSMELYK